MKRLKRLNKANDQVLLKQYSTCGTWGRKIFFLKKAKFDAADSEESAKFVKSTETKASQPSIKRSVTCLKSLGAPGLDIMQHTRREFKPQVF